MTNDPLPPSARELSWRKLSPEQQRELQAWLVAHPDAQPDWELEMALTEALENLPDAPLASNFTARVLQQAERETAKAERERQPARGSLFRLWRRHWVARAAAAAVVISASLLGVAHLREQHRVEEYRRSVASVSEVASLPSPDVLQDFDAIRALDQRAAPDEELLKALQ